jgi:hypothetical protein
MSNLEKQITQILEAAREGLTSVEITVRLNVDFASQKIPHTIAEIERCANKMPNVTKSERKYCLQPEDTSQAAGQK